MIIASAKSHHDLEIVTSEIHDWWFDVDDVSVSHGVARLFLIPSGTFGGRPKGQATRVLLVRCVVGTHVDDEQGIGLYDIHSLYVERDAKRIVIKTNIPTRVEFDVECVDVVVEMYGAA